MRAANHIRKSTLALATCAMFAAVSPARATDGEILINQGKVNAGGITAGDAAGFPATLSKPGRYKLSGNLSVPANMNGIEVTADDVTINLNGFTITGEPTSGYGIVSMGGSSRLRIANGTVTGFNVAGLNPGPFSAVENMRLVSNNYGFSGVGPARITSSTIVNNNLRGIECNSGCSIEGNIVAGTANTGIYLPGGAGMVVGNVIAGNGGYGLSSAIAATGYGQNILVNNGAQVFGSSQLHPNVCDPACP